MSSQREELIAQMGRAYRDAARKYYEYVTTPREYLPGYPMYMREVDFLYVLGMGGEGGLSMGQLAVGLGVTQGAVTQIANRLLRKGKIRRYQSGIDHRRFLVETTPLGDQVRQGHSEYKKRMSQELARRVFSSLDEEQIRLLIWFENSVAEVFDAMNRSETEHTTADAAQGSCNGEPEFEQ